MARTWSGASGSQYEAGSATSMLMGGADPRGGTAPGSAGVTAGQPHTGQVVGEAAQTAQGYASYVDATYVPVGSGDTASMSDESPTGSPAALDGGQSLGSMTHTGAGSGHVGGPPHVNSANGRGPEV